MKYRNFGSLKWRSSILALGTGGLPLRDDDLHLFDEAASVETIRTAIDLGLNYLDLGYPYDAARQERLGRLVREALEDGYREKCKIAISLPSHLIGSSRDFDLYLDRQLNWLGMETADFCLFGRLNREIWPVVRGYGAVEWCEDAIHSGRIGFSGFSLRDHFQVLKAVVAAWDAWHVCQLPFSYMDADRDPGIGAIKYAAGKGLAVVVSEPLKSGRLARELPAGSAKPRAMAPGRSLAEWGFRFIWNYPEIATTVHDVRSAVEVAEYAAYADTASPDSLTVQEEIWFAEMRDARRSLERIPCKSCRPCMPCPEAIDVPRIFELYNDVFAYGDVETARVLYRKELHQAAQCTACGLCESRCVKKLAVNELLEQARRLLE